MNWFSVKKRTIYLGDVVNADMSSMVCKALLKIAPSKKHPLRIVINSPGGDVSDALAIYDAIRSYPGRKEALAVGVCESAAMLPFLACDVRSMSPYSTLMIHHGTTGIGSKHHKEFVVLSKEMDRLDDVYLEIIAERSQIPINKIRRMARFSTHFTRQEAIEQGFVSVPQKRRSK